MRQFCTAIGEENIKLRSDCPIFSRMYAGYMVNTKEAVQLGVFLSDVRRSAYDPDELEDEQRCGPAAPPYALSYNVKADDEWMFRALLGGAETTIFSFLILTASPASASLVRRSRTTA